MSDKEITITNANHYHSFISFKINGLKDGITVGIVSDPDSHGQALSVAYKGEVKIVPLNANSKKIDEINENDEVMVPLHMSKEDYEWLISPADDDGYIPFDTISIDEKEPCQLDKVTELDDKVFWFPSETPMPRQTGKIYKMNVTYAFPENEEPWQPDQVTELDDEAFDAFEKEIMNPEPDMEKVEAAKKIFEGVDKVPVDTSDLWKHERIHCGEPHMLELMDEWGINGDNYNDFRSVIQEHCFDKGLYAFDDIEKTWKSHVKSLKEVVESVKKHV